MAAYQLAPQDPAAAGSTSVAGPKNGDANPDHEAQAEDNHPDNWAGNSFSDKKIRLGFIRKVYLILMIQLTFTVSMICLFLFCTPIKHWVWQNSWFYYVSYGVFVVTLILLVCVPGVRRRVPLNYVCLAIFTMAMTYMTATISCYYDTQIVLICMGITAAVCLAISLFAIQTKFDFTACAGVIYALALVLFLFGLACLITYLVVGDEFTNHVMSCVYGGLAALVFSLFLVLDTQMVVGGKNRKVVLSPEEYVSGALQLYLDIVYLFWILLSLTGCTN